MITKHLLIILTAVILSSIIASSSLPMGGVLISSILITIMFMYQTIPQWLVIIRFIIYIGGLIVLLSYFLSINPNNKLQPLKLSLILLIAFTTTEIKLKSSIETLLTITPPIIITILNKNLIYLVIIGVALFLVLIVIVNITKKDEGPIRPQSSGNSLTKIYALGA